MKYLFLTFILIIMSGYGHTAAARYEAEDSAYITSIASIHNRVKEIKFVHAGYGGLPVPDKLGGYYVRFLSSIKAAKEDTDEDIGVHALEVFSLLNPAMRVEETGKAQELKDLTAALILFHTLHLAKDAKIWLEVRSRLGKMTPVVFDQYKLRTASIRGTSLSAESARRTPLSADSVAMARKESAESAFTGIIAQRNPGSFPSVRKFPPPSSCCGCFPWLC